MERKLVILLGLLTLATCSSVRPSVAQEVVIEANSSENAESESLLRVRHRLNRLRGVTQRVIYPVIIVTGLDSTSTQESDTSRPDDISRPVSPRRLAEVDPQPLQQPSGPDSLVFMPRSSLGPTPRDLALANELGLLRQELQSLKAETSRAQLGLDRDAANTSKRLSDLESDMDLLLAAWSRREDGGRDTVVISRLDTVIVSRPDAVDRVLPTERIVERLKVDTVFVESKPGPPTVVEIERALLDEGLFQSVDVLFEFNKSALLPVSLNVLASVGQVLRTHAELKIEIGGHADSSGPDAYNLSLSQERANAVRAYLIANDNIQEDRITFRGYGETRPVANNGTATGRALNRRVEFRVIHDQ